MEIGARVASRYTIERNLGRGGMGEVYVAHDDKFGSRIALKVARASGSLHAGFRARFVREARLGNRLGRTEGFVRALDWGELDDATLYLAMDLVENARPLDLATGSIEGKLARLKVAARLVALAHERGVIHRDLKPANFLQEGAGRIWLADFGLAKVPGEPDAPGDGSGSSALTQSGIGLGTPAYMSPEQFEDAKSVDARADVYALGVMLFYALTGRVPYDGTPTAIVKAQERVKDGRQPAPSPRALAPDVPEALDALCRRALAVVADERLATASAFVAGLEGLATAETVALPTSPAPAPSTTQIAEAPARSPARAPAPVATPARTWDVRGAREAMPVAFGKAASPPPASSVRSWTRRLLLGGALVFASGVVLAVIAGFFWASAERHARQNAAAQAERDDQLRSLLGAGKRPLAANLAYDTDLQLGNSPVYQRYTWRVRSGPPLALLRIPAEGGVRRNDLWISDRPVTRAQYADYCEAMARPGLASKGAPRDPAMVSLGAAKDYAAWAELSLLDRRELDDPLVSALIGFAVAMQEVSVMEPEWACPDHPVVFSVKLSGNASVVPAPADEPFAFRVVYRVGR